MADRRDELRDEIDSLKEVITHQTILMNKLILMINLSESDLKNYLHLLD